MSLIWQINQIDHEVNPDGTAGNATNIHWSVSKANGALVAGAYGSEGVSPPVPYTGMTEEDAIAYLESKLDIESIDASLDSQLLAQAQPKSAGGLPWQDNYPQWMVGADYNVDDVVTYQNVGYECIQAHTAQTTWPPNDTPAMWNTYVPPSEGPQPWVQPAGAHDAYNTGDLVTHIDKVWESIVDANVWEPSDSSAQWSEVV